MAKFCTKCGKKLVDGQLCDCEKKEKKEVKETVEVEVASNNANDIVNDYLDVLKGVFVTPIDAMKKYAKNSKFVLALVMLGINVLVFGLFVYIFAGKSVNFIASLSGYGSLLRNYNVDVPISVFFFAVLLMAVFFFCLGGLLHFFCGTIMKKDSDFKSMMGLLGVNAVFTTVTTLVALVCLFINVWLAIFVIAIAGVIFLLNVYHGFTEISKIDKNRMNYVFTTAYVITLFLVCYVLPQIFN